MPDPETTVLTDLPTDVILLIIQYLPPADLLSLCSTTPIFHNDPELRYSAAYWRTAIKKTFRVPNHPVVAGDGRRWMRLYRKMRTQTKIYGWGGNDSGCFGVQPQVIHQDSARVVPHRPMQPLHPMLGQRAPALRIRRNVSKTSVQPCELDKGNAGIIADLQCGGWSTTILDSNGILYVSGVIDHAPERRFFPPQISSRKALYFPPNFQFNGQENKVEAYRYDARTAIKQFSSGRAHILGLSDSGRIWSWDAANRPGTFVRFLTVDLVESDKEDISHRPGAVRQVVGGWSRSSAYVVGTGIITWNPSNHAEVDGHADRSQEDLLLVFAPIVVPDSGYVRSSRTSFIGNAEAHSELVESVGEVTNYILLSGYVIFVTDLGKVFASNIAHDVDTQLPRTIQIYPVSTSTGPASPDAFAIDVCGTYNSFAILKRNGEVLIANDAFLEKLWFLPDLPNHLDAERPKFRKIPCLQNTGVISMAFGDYHFHALHSDGTISSYGHEPQSQGALGLGPVGDDIDVLRGLKKFGTVDRDFLPQALTSGRRVHFEEEKRQWLQHIWEDTDEGADARKNLCFERQDVKAEVSEWVEQRLNNWAKNESMGGNGVHGERDVDDLPAHFALSVAAAGWHSGALVLVDEEQARHVRNSLRVPRTGTKMPSTTLGEMHRTNNTTTPQGASDNAQQSTSIKASAIGAASSLANMAINTVSSWAGSFLGIADRVDWAWVGEGFPRLKLRSGEVMHGDGKVEEWTGPREWKEIEEVVE